MLDYKVERDGKTSNCGIKDGSFGNFEWSTEEGATRRGSLPHWLARPHGATMELEDEKHGGRIPRGEGQPVGWDNEARIGKVDFEHVAEGLQLS